MKYIDIHSHLIFGVDDGSKTLEQSIQSLKEAKKIKLTDIICTPHICHGKKEKNLKIVENFITLREEAKKLGINLYLGNEIMYCDKTIEYLQSKRITTLNRSKYLLIEFNRFENRRIDDVIEALEQMMDQGYQPILAHPELYTKYQKLEYIHKLKEAGVMLQLDATSILRSKAKSKTYKFARKLVKERLVDFVASDSHCNKKRNFISLKKAYKKINKIDKTYANIIFYENPLDIIKEK